MRSRASDGAKKLSPQNCTAPPQVSVTWVTKNMSNFRDVRIDSGYLPTHQDLYNRKSCDWSLACPGQDGSQYDSGRSHESRLREAELP